MYCRSFLVLLVIVIATANELLENDGVLVSSMGDLKTASATWTVIVTMDQPQTLDLSGWEDRINHLINDHLDMASLMIRQLWHSRIAALVRDARMPASLPIQDFNHPTRAKRGLLDIVGIIGKSAFGIATSADVSKVAAAVDETRNRQEVLYHNQETLMSVLNQTRRFVQENRENQNILLEDMHRLHQLSVSNLQKIANISKILTAVQFQIWMDSIISYMEQSVHTYIEQLQLFHLQKNQLYRGWLTEDIVPLPILNQILSKLASDGHRPLSPSWYYQYTPVEPIMLQGTALTFSLNLFGLSTDNYIAYQFDYFPVPLGDNHVRTIKGRRNVAMNSLTVASFEPRACVGANPIVCLPDIIESKPSCEYGLLINNVHQNCSVLLTNVESADDVVCRPFTNKSLVVIAPVRQLTATMRCPGTPPKSIIVNRPQIVEVPADCSLDTPSWRAVGVAEAHAELHLVRPMIVILPRLNISWTDAPPLEASQLLEIRHSASLPIAALVLHRLQPTAVHHKPTTWIGPGILMILMIIGLCAYRHRGTIKRKASAWRKNPEVETPRTAAESADPCPKSAMLYPALGLT